MNWFKKAQAFKPESLEDRNLINEKIRYFENIRNEIEKLSKIVFQDGMFAKEASYTIANDKKISSHPIIQDILLEADKIALDSPWRFATLCADANAEITKRINVLVRQRKDLIEDTMPSRMKGWVDKHGR